MTKTSVSVRVGGNRRRIPVDLYASLIGPRAPRDFESRDGCTYVAEEIRGIPVWPACYMHDYCYANDIGVGRKAEFWFYRNTVRCYTYGGGSLFWGIFHGLVRSTFTRWGGPLRRRLLPLIERHREAAVGLTVVVGGALFGVTLKLLGVL